MNIAVILAGGQGKRLGADIPKQFLKVSGKLVIEHTIEKFQEHMLIDEICIVTHKDYTYLIEDIVNKNTYSKVKKILIGGTERSDSSLASINAYQNDETNLIFHDAVRPLVNERIITDTIKALEQFKAVDVAIPSTDTIIQVKENLITDIPNRMFLMNGQTPQAFKRGTIKLAYDLALQDPNFIASDDCGVVRKYLPNEDIFVVKGEVFNMKLTHKEDLFLLDKLFQLKSESVCDIYPNTIMETGFKDKVIVVFGGSYGIGQDICKLACGFGATVYSFSRTENNVDISDYKSVENSIKEVLKKEGKIDYIVNTAALLKKEPLANMSIDTISQLVNVNYVGSVNILKASFDALKDIGGSVLLFTSSSYTRGRENYAVYSSTKAAVVNLTQALAEEWKTFKINVNCINPERTATPMRTQNFGIENPNSLLSSKYVAQISINSLLSNMTGQIIDVRK
ncbi:2-C-methyl-D-erythritol 4-phosphate cytidylyltransferase [Photobacterium phosphoreum]|uniref:bifunctional cytidylyltransferase/SDR family oxidoreductase n=1 Tax=Photobacterium phosphoreum TaxID=659 RepID=UPI000D160366|nr:bifunctional cytidylyltransferase/SDR family oxidoreductase [Photobacterium phosphoreum]PSW31746.1 2-C-methyl-D-erythritol 4-phosphate cytidylyltransferase [Photobacterium phosphoreum]